MPRQLKSFSTGKGNGNRKSHKAPIISPNLVTQSTATQFPSYPFQPLPKPKDPAPYRYDLSQVLSSSDVTTITNAGVMVCHAVGDTGDYRGQQKDFVAAMMTQDANAAPANQKPAFFYHLGDVIYFAGDIDKYGDNFYETYKDYPAFIVSIPGNHDCQPDDPQDGPVDPNKFPLDGWIQNFMSSNPSVPGSLKTGALRTQMDLPNVYWTFKTPFATIIGLFSNVGEIQGEIHADQIRWFEGELKAADPNLALVVTVHHPPFSGDSEHSGSTAIYDVLFSSFKSTKCYPHLVLSGHVHNYQRFTQTVKSGKNNIQIPCVVAGAGGYTVLGALPTVGGSMPQTPLALGNGLTLEKYDDTNFGFLKLAFTATSITGTYLSAPYVAGAQPQTEIVESFLIDLKTRTVRTA